MQVCVQNLSELCFQLSENSLKKSADCTDLQLVPLNRESQQVKIHLMAYELVGRTPLLALLHIDFVVRLIADVRSDLYSPLSNLDS